MSLSHFVGFFLTTDGLSSGYGAMEGGGDVCFFWSLYELFLVVVGLCEGNEVRSLYTAAAFHLFSLFAQPQTCHRCHQ